MTTQQLNRQWAIQDIASGWNGFTVTNTATGVSTKIDFAWVGSNVNSTGTSEYANCGEFYEVEPRKFADFRNRLHNDDQFAETQVLMNERLNIWEGMRTAGTTSSRSYTMQSTYTAANENSWVFTTDISRYNELAPWYTKYSKLNRFIERINNKLDRINTIVKLNQSAEQMAFKQATKRGNKLLKEWLTKDEYAALMNDELCIKDGEETIVIRKKASAMVEVISKTERRKYCIIPKSPGVVDGDALLSKIMLAKTNPTLLKETALLREVIPLQVVRQHR